MAQMIGKLVSDRKEMFYLVFRVLIGGLFMQHGAQKILGAFGADPAAMFSMFWIGGLVELVGGAAIAVGLLTRLAALLSAIEMAVAYAMFHSGKGLIPVLNGGELALVYFAAFLVVLYHGAGKYSVEKLLLKRKEETF